MELPVELEGKRKMPIAATSMRAGSGPKKT